MRPLLLTTALLFPLAAFAAGSDDSTPPKPSKSTTECDAGMVYDTTSGACVVIKDSKLEDDALYEAAREYAYAGRYDDALDALGAMSEDGTDRILTYKGFIHRKLGDMDKGMSFYQAALEKNPDNILTRSYMGQAFVEIGKTGQAKLQLAYIRNSGGEGTWAETSLMKAIKTGKGYSY